MIQHVVFAEDNEYELSVVKAGWEAYNDGNWEYWTEGSTSYVIDLYLGKEREVLFYKNQPPSHPIRERTIPLPDHLTDPEEAMAWALAVWRMG